jgi:hypothetical protein
MGDLTAIDGPQRWTYDTTTNPALFLYTDPGQPTATHDVSCRHCRCRASTPTINPIEKALPSIEWTWND